ncbi:4-hydroxybenzoate octaprenyltransferase [Candidatus Hartigia pinicola]|nr:4-hydroxybenzoate octaprenyltransferase [Candidatus Hartigia pinicola]
MPLKKWHAYSRLARIDKPIGFFLLLWPTYWSLWISSRGIPSFHILIVFTIGVFLMRSVGCIINDYVDRHLDIHVERTKNRPLPSGEVTEKEAKYIFFSLMLLSFLLVLTLNLMTIYLSIMGILLAWIYPFVKRISHLPQIVLGAAYGWSIPMSFSAVNNSLPLMCWLLFIVNIVWSVIYDTQYAMVDYNDDLKIGIKSTAILFGEYDKAIIGIFQIIMIGLLALVGLLVKFGVIYYISLFLLVALFGYQQTLMMNKEKIAYFKAFRNNNYIGCILFSGILLSYI